MCEGHPAAAVMYLSLSRWHQASTIRVRTYPWTTMQARILSVTAHTCSCMHTSIVPVYIRGRWHANCTQLMCGWYENYGIFSGWVWRVIADVMWDVLAVSRYLNPPVLASRNTFYIITSYNSFITDYLRYCYNNLNRVITVFTPCEIGVDRFFVITKL